MKQKRVREQVIVITGASSGIGLATARMAAKRGARLVLAARNEQVIREVCDEIRASGGQARYVVADVSTEQDVRRFAAEAVGHFGHFDTWINNAGVSIYAREMNTPIDEARKLFDTNFWGTVYGSRVACEHFRSHKGTLINIGSVVSDRAVPLQGFYSASKHAVKAFTDALRMELEEENAPVWITLIKPAAIDTPYPEHAMHHLTEEPKLPSPVYDPRLVAEAILKAAEKPVRDMFVGDAAKLISAMGRMAPRMTDYYMERAIMPDSTTGEPAKPRTSNLYQAQSEGEERGGYPGTVIRRSPYHEAMMHPVLAGALGLGASLAVGALLRGRTTRNR